MQIPYGAVYFRKSNPPRQDWDRDYRQAAEDGMNIFRHWFMWSCIETAPGQYDWEDYDRQMELGRKNGIGTIIAEHLTCPEWMATEHPDWCYVDKYGNRKRSMMGASSSTGGFGNGPCLDVPEAREAAGRFLTELARRYKGHPALIGYDIWNECNYAPDICYCSHTKAKFRKWLEKRYHTILDLNQAWHRYSYTSFEQVEPPDDNRMYPECLDWMEFRKENFYEQMQWRIDTIRAADPDARITAHGCSFSISNMAATCGFDDWLAASKVDSYGFTWVASRRGAEPWKQLHAVDVVRSAARGKTFWHSETQGGPLWLQPQCVGRPREDGRITAPEDIRLWNFVSLMGGTRGFLNPRWRPLLDGPLFGAFGAYGMDGKPTPNSRMASRMAKWLNDPAQAELLSAKPVQGEIGILVIPEVQMLSTMLWNVPKHQDPYEQMMWGAYRGFFDNHIQADWVHPDDMDQYDFLYLPYPIMLKRETKIRLKQWVENGGTLICEGFPGYFGEHASVCPEGLPEEMAELFGAEQESAEFTPDLLEDLVMKVGSNQVYGAAFLQTYSVVQGKAFGDMEDGRVIAVMNSHGKGRTLLIGSYPSRGYYCHHDEESRRFFADLFPLFGRQQRLKCSNPKIAARLQKGEGGTYLWLVNYSAEAENTKIILFQERADNLSLAYGEYKPVLKDGVLQCTVGGKDALIVRLNG